MYKTTFFLVFLLISCNGEQPEIFQKEQSNHHIQQIKPLKIDAKKADGTQITDEPKKKVTPKEEEELPEAFFIHEGGDIQDLEFDEEGNIIE